jgi:hypothetical protein
MSERSTRRRLNLALARLRRREEADPDSRRGVDPAAPPAARSLQTIARLLAAFVVVVAALGVAIAFLQWRQTAALDDRVNSLVKAMADREGELKKSAEATDRALAVANQQSAALENANKIASDALAVGRRAWLGVTGARIDGRLEPNADLTIVVEYRNTGREPATNLAVIATPFVIEAEKRAEPSTMSRLEQFADRCMAENYVGASIAFPSDDTQKYQAEAVIKASDVDNALVDGRKLVIVETCIVYMSSGAIHHSAACNFFQGGRTPQDRFAACAKGAAAD